MAFDYGQVRIGVAIGNTSLKIPHPIEVVTGRGAAQKIEKIRQLINKWGPAHLVVGMPSEGEDKRELIASINKFAKRLHNRFNLPVSFINEDYTSSLASEQLYQQNIAARKQKSKLDELAACAILASYFAELQVNESVT